MMKLELIRSDAGDGGWSLHAPGYPDDEEGISDSLLMSGEAEWSDETDDWNRPDQFDYTLAEAKLAWRETAQRIEKL